MKPLTLLALEALAKQDSNFVENILKKLEILDKEQRYTLEQIYADSFNFGVKRYRPQEGCIIFYGSNRIESIDIALGDNYSIGVDNSGGASVNMIDHDRKDLISCVFINSGTI